MKNIDEVLREKEIDLARVRAEVEALRRVIPLLIEQGEEEVSVPGARVDPESASAPCNSPGDSPSALAV